MKVPNTEANGKKCICGGCPSYLGANEGFFCSSGKSKKKYEQKGCICGQCALWKEYKLNGGYFCINGQAV